METTIQSAMQASSLTAQDGSRPPTLYTESDSDTNSSASSDTAQAYYSPCEGSSSGDEQVIPNLAKPRDELYLTLRKQAGQAGADFCYLEDRPVVQAGGSTLAVFLLFRDETRRDECWSILDKTIKVRAEVWFSGQQCPQFPSTSGSESGGDDDEGSDNIDEAAIEECSIVLLLDLHRPLSGCWTGPELQRAVEKYLGCPRSRGGRLSPTLKRMDFISFELIPLCEVETWLKTRSNTLAECRKLLHVPEVIVTERS